MEKLICQSCGMPMDDPALYGTEQDGSHNEEYCIYCYANGAFTGNETMDEMIDHCLEYLDQYNGVSGTNFTEDEARAQMREYFPTLKRWKK